MNKMNKKPIKKTPLRKAHIEKEVVLQAVVVTDTFNKYFAPASSCPSLLPLVNKKLLDYSLEWLDMSGVNEVIVMCSSYVNEIKEQISKKTYLNVDIRVLVSDDCRSFGDLMRALDRYAVIRNTFILLTVDVIGNLNFTRIVEKFKTIQKVDKEACMMLLFKEIGNQRTDLSDNFTVAYDSNNRIIHYQTERSSNIQLPLEAILEQDYVEIRNNLSNPGVAICSVAVPPLFSDNFDIQTVNDFIRRLLVNEEIAQSTIYSEIVNDSGYVAKVKDWPMYQIISEDVIKRWTYPLVPDISEKYTYGKNSVYLKNTTTDIGCKLNSVVVGNETKLQKNVSIRRSVIGDRCIIGDGVVIENSYIFNNVKIEENCVVRYSVIGEYCYLKKKCILDPNCVLGPRINLNAETTVSNMSLLSNNETAKSKIVPWVEYKNSDSEDEEASSLMIRRIVSSNDDDFVEDDCSSINDSESSIAAELDDVNVFYNEILDSLSRGFEEKSKWEHLVLEINASRYANNVTINEVNQNVMQAILGIRLEKEKPTLKDVLQHTVSKLTYFLPVIRNYIKDYHAQRDCLSAIEISVVEDEMIRKILPKIIEFLYDEDILLEKTILMWYNDVQENDIHNLKDVLSKFIEWLKEAEEDSE